MKEAQESKCQNLKCKARGKALSLKCHFFCSLLFTLASNSSKSYCTTFTFSALVWLRMSSPPHSKFFKFQTSDCYKLGNVHSLQMATYYSYIKLTIFLMSHQLYKVSFTVKNRLVIFGVKSWHKIVGGVCT